MRFENRLTLKKSIGEIVNELLLESIESLPSQITVGVEGDIVNLFEDRAPSIKISENKSHVQGNNKAIS